MRDVTKIDFSQMNEELRVELILAHLGEAIEMEWPDKDQVIGVRKILQVPDGTSLRDVEIPEDVENETDLEPVQYVVLTIDHHYGNMV